MSPAFSAESQKVNEPVIIDVIERFCETLKPSMDTWGATWNITEQTTYLGFDIMGGLVFGCDFRSVQEENNRDLANSVIAASRFLYWVCGFSQMLLPPRSNHTGKVSYLPLAVLVRPLLRTKLFEVVGGKPVVDNNRLIDYANGQVQSRNSENEGSEKGANAGRIDFLSRIINTQDKKTGWRPTPADLDTECLNMMNAGADPYSGVLAGAFFYLVHNEETLQRATTEVR